MLSKEFLVFGLHSVESLLHNQPQRIIHLCVQQGRKDQKMALIVELAKQQSVVIREMSRQELDRLVNEANHQGVVAVCTQPQRYVEADLQKLLTHVDGPAFALVLDGVQDPHNLGACFRSAEAAGVHVIITPKDNSVGITPVVSKVASGAAERIPFVQVTNLARTLSELKELGLWIFGATADAPKTLYQTDLSGPVAIVLGAEGRGLRRLTRERCDGLINIPMAGSVESLNVSVAAGVILFEVVRQRMQK